MLPETTPSPDDDRRLTLHEPADLGTRADRCEALATRRARKSLPRQFQIRKFGRVQRIIAASANDVMIIACALCRGTLTAIVA